MNQVTLAIGFGLVTASILALCAVGFTLQFGVSNIFNLAYGDVMTASAYVAYVVNVVAGAPIWVAFAAGAAAAMVISVAINRFVYAPFLRRGTSLFAMVMVTLAVGTILQFSMQATAGNAFRGFRLASQRSYHLLGVIITPRQLAILAIAAGAMVALHLLLRYTRIGKAMRATASDPELARTCGIATARTTDVAWAVSGALCGMGGVALALNLATFDSTVGVSFLLVIVAAAVFGSVGQPYGAMAGALVIGLSSELAALVTPSLKQVVAFAVLVVVLLARPNGLWRGGYIQQGAAVR